MATTNYKQEAKKSRLKVLDMVYEGQSSHIGSNFSCIDLLTVMFDKANLPKDRIIFSKGWVAASAYYFLSEKGIVPKEALETYCKEGSKYIGLLEPYVPGVDVGGGSMGYGLPFAVGFGLANKMNNDPISKIFVLMSDGEMNIGTTWESALLAGHHLNENLRVIVDCNGYQAMGKTDDVLYMGSLKEKWKAFGWTVLEIDGHNFKQIEYAMQHIVLDTIQPIVVLARTVKGKGVKFMENDNLYHYKNLTEQEYQTAKAQLE